jgi:hypothetical protein
MCYIGIIVSCYDVAAIESVSASYNTDTPLPPALPFCSKVDRMPILTYRSFVTHICISIGWDQYGRSAYNSK